MNEEETVAIRPSGWKYGDMARTKTTLLLDERLMRMIRVRAARTGRTQSEVMEAALREGFSVIDRIRAKANLDEEEALRLASEVVHEIRHRETAKKAAKRKG